MFKRLELLNHGGLKVIRIAAVVSILVAAFLTTPSVNAAGESFNYASSGAKITGKGGSFGSATSTFTKSPIQAEGKDVYTGSAKVKGKDGDCTIGLSISVSPGASSGAISAPAFLNGLSGAGAPGTNYVPSCDKSFAAGFADFNKSISVSTANTGTPAPSTETAGQKEIIATVYSDKKVSTLPSVKVALAKTSSLSTAASSTVDWNSSTNIGSARWSNIEPGTYRVCITPGDLFTYFDDCQNITKVAGTAARVNFGSTANNLNKEGKQLSVKVNLSIPAGTDAQTYGPIGITIYESTTKIPAGPTGETGTLELEAGNRPNGQTVTLEAKLDGLEPGTYIACVTGNSDLCSSVFTKEANAAATAEINIPEDMSLAFLSSAGQPTCAVEGVGWIVCPVISFTATIADSAFSYLSDNFLSVNIGVVATDSATYQVWVIMRNIANLAFVIAFLFIIFSQLTGQGIANYGIKKLLPRIVIAAILVNLSFYICQLAVDLSNVLGYSINQAFQSIGAGISLPNGAVSTDESTNWVGITAAVLAGGAIAWSLGISVLLPFLLGAVIALVMVFVILVLRQMLIILLVIIAPIAFVAFLLPNTEQWFAKWRKMFTSLLLVFPMIGLLFGAASVASVTLKAATYSTDDAGGVIGKIVAAGIVALPLFMLPSLLKGSLNSVGNIGAKLNGMSGKLSKGGRSKLAGSGVMKSLAHQKQTRRAQIGAGIYDGNNPLSKVRSGLNGRLNRNKAYNKMTGNYGTIRGANIEKLENEETKLAEAAVQLRAREGTPGTSLEEQFNTATASGDIVRAKAAQNILMRSGSTGVASVRRVIENNEGKLSEGMRTSLASNIAENHGQVAKQKAPDLLKWSTNPNDENGNKMNMGQISAAAKTWGGLSARELADLPDGSFASAMSSGGVSRSTLDALKSDRMRENLSDGQRTAISTYRDPSSIPPPTVTNTGSAGATTGGGTSTSGRAPTRSTPQSENNFLTPSTAPSGPANPANVNASTTSVDVPLGTARVETRQQPTEVIVNPSVTATSEGLYRINSAGKPIRPKNSSKKNDGALIGAQQAAVIDANAGLIRSMAGAQAAAAAAQKASLNRGETFDQAKAAADEAYRKNSGA